MNDDRLRWYTVITMQRLFDLPEKYFDSQIHLLSFPWDASASFRRGTAQFPSRFYELSHQIDAFDRRFPKHADRGFFWDDQWGTLPTGDLKTASLIDAASFRMMEQLRSVVLERIQLGKRIIVLGGDHSVPLGSVQAHATFYSGLGVLQVDAHMDFRDGYEGITYSHASIMHHVAQLPGVAKIVQLGIRDYCQEEYQVMVESGGRIVTYFDDMLASRLFQGETWHDVCLEILSQLPDDVYLTVDVDGLASYHAPYTGTPVPGGLSYCQLMYLLSLFSEHGKRLVGFDLVEVSSVEEDVIFATHLLYRISQYLA